MNAEEMSLGRFKPPNLTSSHRVFPLLRLTIKNWSLVIRVLS